MAPVNPQYKVPKYPIISKQKSNKIQSKTANVTMGIRLTSPSPHTNQSINQTHTETPPPPGMMFKAIRIFHSTPHHATHNTITVSVVHCAKFVSSNNSPLAHYNTTHNLLRLFPSAVWHSNLRIFFTLLH